MAAPSGSAAWAASAGMLARQPEKKSGGGGGGDDSSGRQRKPYVMSKPRETWTDAEHSLFIEALKLYTREWKKIQQHVKTKTAVQIRSHAQKYFQKLIKNGQRHEVPDARAKRPSGSVSKGKRRRSVQQPLAADATAGCVALPPLCTAAMSAAGGPAMRRVPSACAGSGDDIGSCSGSAQSPEAEAREGGVPLRKSRRTAARAAMQRDADSDVDSEADGAADTRAAVPASGFRQTPAMQSASMAQAAQLSGHPAAGSPHLGPDAATGQGVTPQHWLSHGFGGFATGSAPKQCMRTAAAAAAADFRYPSVPLTNQAFYPGPPGYPVWQQMCGGAAAPKAPNASMYNTSGGGGSGSLRTGSGHRSGSGSGFNFSGGAGGGDAVVPSMSPCAPPLQGGQPGDSIWAEEREAVTNPAAMQELPNFRQMYGFIGNLFDESCRGNDHAAALAGMSAATRSEAGRCLQRLLNNMQAPVWEGRTLAQKTSQASSQTAC